jgi:hypothetical protein
MYFFQYRLGGELHDDTFYLRSDRFVPEADSAAEEELAKFAWNRSLSVVALKRPLDSQHVTEPRGLSSNHRGSEARPKPLAA